MHQSQKFQIKQETDSFQYLVDLTFNSVFLAEIIQPKKQKRAALPNTIGLLLQFFLYLIYIFPICQDREQFG